MFNQLVESHRVGQRRAGGVVLSAVVHAGIIAAAIVATARVGRAIMHAPLPPEHHVYFVAAPSWDARPSPKEARVTKTIPKLPPIRELAPSFDPCIGPIALPDARLPEPSPGVIGWVMPFSGSGHGDGVGERVPPGARPLPIAFDAVEHPPHALASNPLPRYPAALERSGITGHVLTQFIIDTSGRVEEGSLRVLSSDHPWFAAAVAEVMPRLRFQPGWSGGRAVRVLAQRDFAFALR